MVPHFSTVLVPAGLLIGASLLPTSAWACTISGPGAHAIDPTEAEVDHTAPHPPTGLQVVDIQRGTGPACDRSGVCSSTSCDDIAWIRLAWTPGGDDRTVDADLGARVRVVSGTAPEGMWPFDDAVRPFAAGTLDLVWIDGATDDQEALDFTIEVAELDRAGNESTPTRLRVTHRGTTTTGPTKGCSVVGTTGAAALLLVLPAIARRRR